MEHFTRHSEHETLVGVETWFTLEDVVKWYILDEIEERGGQEDVAEVMGIPRNQLGLTIRGKGKRRFYISHLQGFVKDMPQGRAFFLFDRLMNIAWDMEKGIHTKEDLQRRISESSKRGRKPSKSPAATPATPALPPSPSHGGRWYSPDASKRHSQKAPKSR